MKLDTAICAIIENASFQFDGMWTGKPDARDAWITQWHRFTTAQHAAAAANFSHDDAAMNAALDEMSMAEIESQGDDPQTKRVRWELENL